MKLPAIQKWHSHQNQHTPIYSRSILDGTREYNIDPWTSLDGLKSGYMLRVNDTAADTQHEVLPSGEAVDMQFMPSHYYRTLAEAHRAANKHNKAANLQAA